MAEDLDTLDRKFVQRFTGESKVKEGRVLKATGAMRKLPNSELLDYYVTTALNPPPKDASKKEMLEYRVLLGVTRENIIKRMEVAAKVIKI